MVVFLWLLLLDKFSFIENMFKQKVVGEHESFSCILCGDRLQYVSHIFVTRNLSSSVWYKISQWLEVRSTLPSEPKVIFLFF